MRKFCLPIIANGCYGFPIAPQWAIRRGNLKIQTATPDAKASFFVSDHYAHLISGLARNESMVALVGQLNGWLVSVCTSISTPANVTTPLERGNSGGDSLNQTEIIIMMATPTQTHPTFIWRFFSCQNATYHTVTAHSEREARNLLPDSPYLFAARLPVQEVNHGA